MKIAASMIVKNEEVMLPDCLKSIRSVDKVFIADTGSTDRTIEIAKRFKCVVDTSYKWNDNFSEARNHALKMIPDEYEWILIIDADEVLQSSINAIKLLASGKTMDKFNAIKFDVKTGREVNAQIRLFRNDKNIQWFGEAHNLPYYFENGTKKELNHFKSSFKIDARFSPSHEKDPDRTLRILSKALLKDPFNSRYLYYVSREWLNRKDPFKAIYYLNRYIDVAPQTNEKADAYYLLATCYMAVGDLEKSFNSCLNSVKTLPTFKAPWIMMANISYPKYKPIWEQAARIADNSGVLFIREDAEKIFNQK